MGRDTDGGGGTRGSGNGKARSLRITVRAVVIVMVVVLGSLALYFWVRTERVVTDQFATSQRTVARLGAMRLQGIVHDLEKVLLIQSRLGCTGSSAGDEEPMTDREALERIGDLGATEILRATDGGKVISAASTGPGGVQALFSEAAADCGKAGTEDVCIGTAERPPGPGLAGHTLMLARRLPACGGGGRIAVLVSWNRLGGVITEETSIGRFSLGWILDERGTLLFHPKHPEMIRRNIQNGDSTCSDCHRDFEVAGRMSRGGSGIDQIDVKGAGRKLVSFHPVEVGGRRWSLAVSAPYSSVVTEYRRTLVVAILISGLLIGVFLFVSYFLDRENTRHIEALHANKSMIESLNAELEGKVAQRTREVESLYEEMRAIQGRYDAHQRLAIVGELASMVAHEIRTPLNSLAISSQRLVRELGKAGGADAEKLKKIVESQDYEVQRINDYIEEYLKFSRLPRRKAGRTDIVKVAGRLEKFFSIEGARSGVRLHVQAGSPEAYAEVDEEQITQVLLNLLVNAIQAMPSGGDVFLETAIENDAIRVLVRDTGVGIAREHLAEVFKPFFTTREEGTGLGLAICARIVEENGGSIDCFSEQGHGTTFRIRIPLCREEAGQGQGDRAHRR